MVLIFPYIFPSTFNALAVWPFIILKEPALRTDFILIHHERIHLRQQLELLWVFFFIIYLTEFLAKIIIYKQPKLAYRNISFEREAYENEYDLDYARKKPLWSFVGYIFERPSKN